jgi:hypothetical protein
VGVGIWLRLELNCHVKQAAGHWHVREAGRLAIGRYLTIHVSGKVYAYFSDTNLATSRIFRRICFATSLALMLAAEFWASTSLDLSSSSFVNSVSSRALACGACVVAAGAAGCSVDLEAAASRAAATDDSPPPKVFDES